MAGFAAVDVGTSFLKAAIVDPDALTVSEVRRAPFPPFAEGLPALWREADPRAVLRAVEELLAGFDRAEGLLLCGQMHGFVLVDGRGEAVSNYISWLDQRVTADEFADFAERVTPAERAELGNEFKPGIALPLLWWLGRHGALPEGATPVSIADYVAARLCGATPVMEPTQAAAFGALRLGTLAWHGDAIGRLGLDALRWPEVHPPGSVAGRWRGVPCYAAAGDQQAALAGALLAEGELSINIGTGSQVAMLSATAKAGDLQVRPYFDGGFLRTVTHIPGGRALSALAALLAEIGGVREDEAWRHIVREVASVSATDLRAGIAFYPGPSGAAGFLENLHEGNLRVGHVFRAAFESMARNYEECARALTGRAMKGVVFSGGVARRLPPVRELTAAALGLPWRLSPHGEDTLFGLMVLARAWSGRDASVRAATETVRAAIPAGPGE